MNDRTTKIILAALFFLCLFVFSRGLNTHGIEYRDDEIFYFHSTQEMIQDGNYLSPTYFGENRFQKPILFYWFIIIAYKIFGFSWLAARMPSVVCAGLTVCVTWLLARSVFRENEKAKQVVPFLSCLILITNPMFFRHAKDAVPDMAFNFFIVLALYFAFQFISNAKEKKWRVWFFVACALGFMIKGFAALIVPFLALFLYFTLTKRWKFLGQFRFGQGMLILLAIVLPWFLYMIYRHGSSYLTYMVVEETQNRLLHKTNANPIIGFISSFFQGNLFYLEVIMSYFAPWSPFIFGGIPIAIRNSRQNRQGAQGLLFLVSWFAVVFIFFSIMHFRINHYMLVLTTPFAILVAHFLFEMEYQNQMLGKIINGVKRYFLIFLFTVSLFAFTFLLVFLAEGSPWWLAILLVCYLVILSIMLQSPKTHVQAICLGVFLVMIFSQTTIIREAGIITHSSLSKFAETINQDQGEYVIGVGSHDIHEKEWQVYFDRQIVKAATDDLPETVRRLGNLINNDDVYCLIIEKDFNEVKQSLTFEDFEMVQEELMFRKRMNIDQGFFVALMKLDQATVTGYLKEKVLLLKKKS